MKVGYLSYSSPNKQDYIGPKDRLELPIRELFSMTGSNLGNLAFRFAARRLFAEDIEYFTYHDRAEALREKVDVLVLPEANLVNPNIDYGPFAAFIAKANLPVFLLGVGSQLSDSTKLPEDFPDLPEGTKHYLREIANRTSNILVRGEFTKQVLKHQLGISNVQVAGCPSYLINSSPSLFKELSGFRDHREILERVAVTEGIYDRQRRTADQIRAEKFLFQLVRFWTGSYIGQQNFTVLKYGLGYSREVTTSEISNLRFLLAPSANDAEFARLMRNKAMAFVRIDEWISALRNHSAVIGSRIHGNILGLQAGVPALPIIHDARTSELVNTLQIPHLELSDFESLSNIDEVSDLFINRFFPQMHLILMRAVSK